MTKYIKNRQKNQKLSPCGRFGNFIQSQDIFGQPIELNADDSQKYQKSTFGGAFSILLIAYMFFFIFTNLKKIQNVEDSDIKNFHGRVNLTEQGTLLYKETDFKMMYSLKKQSATTKIPLDELSRYIKVSFIQVMEDWHDFKEKDRHQRSFEVRECDITDFGDGDNSLEHFRVWKHRNLFCPVESDQEPLVLENHEGDNKNKHIVFQIDRCQNSSSNLNHCFSDEQIDDYVRDMSVEGWAQFQNLDFTSFGQIPTFREQQLQFQNMLGLKDFATQRIYISKVKYQSNDGIFNLMIPKTFEGVFYKIKHIVGSVVKEDQEQSCLFQSRLYLTPLQQIIFRQAYDINNMLGDLGGVFRVLMTFFGVIFYPISQFLFYLNSTRKLYYARTKDDELFENIPLDKSQSNMDRKMIKYTKTETQPDRYKKCVKNEFQKHRFISLSSKDKFLLFIYNTFGFMMCKRVCPWSKRDKLQKLYDRTKIHVEQDFNVLKIVKTLKMLKVAMKMSILTKKVKYETIHSRKCTIDLDSQDECSHDSFSIESESYSAEQGNVQQAPIADSDHVTLSRTSNQLQKQMMGVQMKNRRKSLFSKNLKSQVLQRAQTISQEQFNQKKPSKTNILKSFFNKRQLTIDSKTPEKVEEAADSSQQIQQTSRSSTYQLNSAFKLPLTSGLNQVELQQISDKSFDSEIKNNDQLHQINSHREVDEESEKISSQPNCQNQLERFSSIHSQREPSGRNSLAMTSMLQVPDTSNIFQHQCLVDKYEHDFNRKMLRLQGNFK